MKQPGVPRAAGRIIGSSPALHVAEAEVEMYAPESDPLVVVGNTGVGKSLLVRRLHDSGRPAQRLVTVSAAELSPDIYQSQLYGHVRGAFTGATADAPGFLAAAGGGTLFVDELHLLEKMVQAAFLRVLQDRTWTPVGSTRELQVGCRFVFATHRPIDELMGRGILLPDLRWRLGEAVIVVPDLLERLDDVPDLAEAFLARKGEEVGRTAPLDPLRFSVPVMVRLMGYGWLGNVRELENVVREASLRATFQGRSVVEIEDLPGRFRGPGPAVELSRDVRRIVVGWASKRKATTREEIAEALGVSKATVDLDRHESKT